MERMGAADTTRILVISPSAQLGLVLSYALPARFDVIDVRPGPAVLQALRHAHPRVAVVDRIDERPEAAQLEIALVKDLAPAARIIALTGKSSEADASVVEQGLFYYMAESLNGELKRVIHAAAQAAERDECRSNPPVSPSASRTLRGSNTKPRTLERHEEQQR